MDVFIPPLKIQGIKTKMIPWIRENAIPGASRWVEPFMGSGAIGFNMPFRHKLLCDANRHVIGFYEWLRNANIVSAIGKLREMGKSLSADPDYYYRIREEYNAKVDPLKLLFLSRTCFNGIMRFSSKGNFNTPFCKNPDKLSPEILDSLLFSMACIQRDMNEWDIQFLCNDWRDTIAMTNGDDIVYCDPPYSGRETGYIGSWTLDDDIALMDALQGKRYMVSSWLSDGTKTNPVIGEWEKRGARILEREHRYMVGPKAGMRPKVIEVLLLPA